MILRRWKTRVSEFFCKSKGGILGEEFLVTYLREEGRKRDRKECGRESLNEGGRDRN